MFRLAKRLAKLAEGLKSSGREKEAFDLFHHAVRLAHDENPLMKVLGEYGFEPSEVFEYGNDDELDKVHESKKSVHRDDGDQVREIWINIDPESGKIEYGYMHEGGEYGHKHAYYDNLEDLVAHIVEEDEESGHDHYEDDDRPNQLSGKGYASEQDDDCGCGCGGSCGGHKHSAAFRVLEKYAKSSKKKKNVHLNKPFRTPGGPKKFSVYVKNDKGNIVKVNFGDPNMKIKKNIPERRKSFRARHHCESPGPKWKARYWSCRNW
jgi:hypothetical protein